MFTKSSKKKIRGKLSIDTTCAVQPGVLPYETRVPELKFVSYEQSAARVTTSKQDLDSRTPLYEGAEQAVSSGIQGHVPSVRSQRGAIVATPGADHDTSSLPYHKRLASKRPEPLKLKRGHADNQQSDHSTPAIVITPAREDFHDTQTLQVKGRRPASSVYSRYTNCMTTSSAPPVPPLPFMGKDSAGLKSRFSIVTATTSFEDVSPLDSADTARPAQTPGLPTPRRSKGWWNVLSPFSAKSALPSFWRSPSPASDHTPVLKDAAAMGQASEESRSASCDDTDEPVAEDSAAFRGSSPLFDMYFIASTGLAAAYFDVARRFPSIYGQEKGDWSPSQSVYLSSPDGSSAKGQEADSPHRTAEQSRGETIEKGVGADFASVFGSQSGSKAAVFSTPSAEELQTPALARKTPVRAMTQTTNMSVFSPLSATPEVHEAHLGMPIGPASYFGEQKQIAVSRAPTPAVLDENVASCTSAKHTSIQEPPSACNVARLRPSHTRQDSYGLGISDEKNELFPPPKYVVEERPRPRLGTDRFGQLTVRSPGDDKPLRPWYRRHFWLLAFLAAAVVIILVVLLAMFVPQRHHDASVQASWLNLTGLPAVPIGISTIIRPQVTSSRDTCTEASIWTCAGPVSDLPDFRLEIRSRDGNSKKRAKRDAWQDYLYNASPSPPSESDQMYLGRTTDNVSEPYNGEETPFYISLLDATALSGGFPLLKRSDINFTYPYPTSSPPKSEETSTKVTNSPPSNIPNAAVTSSGKPLESLLYPYVTAQPLKLYNKGQDSEHYAFYSYFDRVIYINSSDPSASPPWNTTTNTTTSNVPLENASAVCTFTQSRLHIQIWTKRGTLPDQQLSINSTTSFSSLAAADSSANAMSAPGSFPYPVTLTIDRHGGLASNKGVYCYALDDEGKVDNSVKGWVVEDRGVGGVLVDGAEVPGDKDGEGGLTRREDETAQGKGIDGGTGGCQCRWEHE